MKNIDVRDIMKIYFLSDNDDEALVLYREVIGDMNTYQSARVSKKTGKNLLESFAKTFGYSSLEELRKEEVYEVVSEKDLSSKVKEFKSILEDEDENIEQDIFDDLDDDKALDDEYNSLIDKAKNKLKDVKIRNLKVKKIALTTGLILGGIVIGTCVYNLGAAKERKKALISSTESEEITTEVIPTSESVIVEDTSYAGVDDILTNAYLNDSKKTAIDSVWTFINYYNDDFSSKHICSDGTRLALSWDEVMIDYLVYNNISGEEAVQIFDDCNLDPAVLKSAYTSSVDQAVLAYTVITEPMFKEDLIKSEVGKEFYKKYEDMIIRFNKTGDDVEAKEKIAQEFYTEVYADFLNESSITANENYKLAVLPIVKAFNQLTVKINCDNKIDEANLANIENLINVNFVSAYIDNICTTVNNKTSMTTSDECCYTEIEDMAIEELSDNNAYNLQNRNISNSLEYKSMFKESEEKDEATTEEKINNNSGSSGGYYNNNSGYSNSNSNTAGEVPDEQPDQIPDWLLNDDNQDNNSNTNSDQNNDVDDSVNEEVPDVEEDTPDMSFFGSNRSNRQAYYEQVANAIIEKMAKPNTENVKQAVYVKRNV